MAFLNANCVCAFKRVGAATKDGVTCACLQDMQVRQSIGGGDKKTDAMHIAVQEANSTPVSSVSIKLGMMPNIFRQRSSKRTISKRE